MIVTLIIILLAICYYDIKTHRIPNWVTFGGMILAVTYNIIFPGDLKTVLLAIAVGIIGVAIINITGFQKLGGGDAKLISMIGAFTASWKIVILIIVWSYVTSSLFRFLYYGKGTIAYSPFITLSFIGALCLNVI